MVGGRLRCRAANSDEAFVRSLYEEHGGAVVAYSTKLTGDRAAAEDVLQETLVRAWRRPEVLVNGRGSVRAWMLTVAHNLVVDRIRARAARPTEVAGHPAREPLAPDPAAGVIDRLTLRQAMDRLTEEHRIVLTQLYYRGCTVREAAAELDIPTGTVKSRSYHALRALRRALAGMRVELQAMPACWPAEDRGDGRRGTRLLPARSEPTDGRGAACSRAAQGGGWKDVRAG